MAPAGKRCQAILTSARARRGLAVVQRENCGARRRFPDKAGGRGPTPRLRRPLVLYWTEETIRTRFEERCRRDGFDPDEALVSFLGGDVPASDFSQRVKTNLQAGKIRLIFVADVIPSELRRIVEFLNQQMDPGEVLAVEIRQYAGRS